MNAQADHPDALIRAGVIFATPFEKGCVAKESPNSHGSFLALDSDGVECHFHMAMVVSVGEWTRELEDWEKSTEG